MAVSDQLERARLKFIQVCEKLAAAGRISEEEFWRILDVLERLDEFDEKEFAAILEEATRGAVGFSDWDSL